MIIARPPGAPQGPYAGSHGRGMENLKEACLNWFCLNACQGMSLENLRHVLTSKDRCCLFV